MSPNTTPSAPRAKAAKLARCAPWCGSAGCVAEERCGSKPAACCDDILYQSTASVLADDRERAKSSCGSGFDCAARLAEIRGKSSSLEPRFLTFGEDCRVDLLEEFAVQHRGASLHLGRRHDEVEGQFRTAAGENRNRNLQGGQCARGDLRSAVNPFSD